MPDPNDSDAASPAVGDACEVPFAPSERVIDIALALGADGSRWLAVRAVESNGERARIAVTRLASDYASGTESPWNTIARGAIGELALGALASAPDGSVVLSYRGEEGLAWITSFDPRGRTTNTRFILPCVEPPGLVIEPLDGDRIVSIRPPRGEAYAMALLDRGIEQRVHAAPRAALNVTLAAGTPGVALGCTLGGVVHIVDANGARPFARLSRRSIAHAPILASLAGRWFAAWVNEDVGKLVMARARLGDEHAGRVAEVWAPLDRPTSSAPALVGDASGGWIAWREERGPRAAANLRRLDGDGEQIGRELRLSDRAAIAAPGRVALASRGDGSVCAAWVEQRDERTSVWTREAFVAA